MKRKIFLNIAFLLLLLTSGYSQSKIGFTAGFNLNNVRLDVSDGDESETALKPGFHIGVVS